MEKKNIYRGEARITDEALADLRARISVERPTKAWNNVATRDAIWHFAHAYGDNNPLYWEEGYAKKTGYGQIVAPPAFILSLSSFSGGGGHGLPGVHALHAKHDMEFYQVIREGDKLRGTTKLVEVNERQGEYSGRFIEQVNQEDFYNQRNEQIAKVRAHVFRMERQRAQEGKKYETLTKHVYTEQELEEIRKQYEVEDSMRRGAAPRYWQDVNEGNELGPMVKGPLTINSMITWLMGWGSPLCKTDRIAWLYFRDHPRAKIVSRDTNIPDFAEAMHWDEYLARQAGIPVPFDIGNQRIANMSHLVTDWMGDAAFLKHLIVEIRSVVVLGDTNWFRGRVTRKYKAGEEGLVDCELWADDQRGRRTTRGFATVRIPLK